MAPKKTASKSGEKKPIRHLVVILPHAPKGKCNTVVRINGEPVQIQLKDRAFECTKKIKGARPEAVFEQLKKQGFVDESYWEGKAEGRKKRPMSPNVKATWKYMHPDNTKQHPINGNVALSVNGEPVQLQVKEGYLKTNDFYTAQELEKRGFILQSVREHKKGGRSV